MDIKDFIQKKIKSNSIYQELYDMGEFSDYEFLCLFANNELKRHGLPLHRGGNKWRRRRRYILQRPLFRLVEDMIEERLRQFSDKSFFDKFVTVNDLRLGDKAMVCEWEDEL